MARLPLFIEVVHSRENAPLAICRKVMALLFRRRIAPLPFGASMDELRPVLASMRQRNTPPAIYVVNTFWAEELLLELDKLMGSTPVLFFQRELFMGSSVARARLQESNATPAGDRSADILRKMKPRPLAVWGYGSKTSDAVAEKAAECLARFLENGDFERLLRSSPQNAAYEQALTAAGANLNKLQVVFDAEPAPPLASAAERQTGSLPKPPKGKTSLLRASGIHGSLQEMALSSLLIILEMEKKSGELVLTQAHESAHLFLSRGRVVDAQVAAGEAPAASLTGAEAVYHALAWTTGPFEFTNREMTIEDKINMPTTSLLMEGARRADEAGRQLSAL